MIFDWENKKLLTKKATYNSVTYFYEVGIPSWLKWRWLTVRLFAWAFTGYYPVAYTLQDKWVPGRFIRMEVYEAKE